MKNRGSPRGHEIISTEARRAQRRTKKIVRMHTRQTCGARRDLLEISPFEMVFFVRLCDLSAFVVNSLLRDFGCGVPRTLLRR